MRIGILGSGNIGGSLGRSWAKAGHEVMFSSRHPEELSDLVGKAGNGASAGTVDEALAFGDVLLDALPYSVSMELDPADVRGKTVISASNYYPQRDGEIELGGASQTEALAKRIDAPNVVKAFNMMQAEEMAKRADGRVTEPLAIFTAGGDEDARRIADQLVRDAGFEPVGTGDLASGKVFQTDGPLYDTKLSPDVARSAFAEISQEG